MNKLFGGFGGYGEYGGYGGYSTFNFFNIIFWIIFIVIIGVFVVALIHGIATWTHNNKAPLLTVGAKVVGRRVKTRVSGGHHGTDSGMHMTSTFHDYYVTFEVESGDRMEFEVPENKYGYIIEGDRGELSFKGTRFIDFERV